MPDLSPADLADLARAQALLERPGLAIRITDAIGQPVEALVRRLPAGAQARLAEVTRRALEVALGVALRTLDGRRPGPAADWLHRASVVATGAAGGAFGLAGLAVELPATLTLMLRSVADHARAQGEDLSAVAGRLECLTVFAYGTRAAAADAAGSAYFAARAALARAVSQAAEWIAERGLAEALGEQGAPVLLQLVARIAPRLGVAVGDKAAAQLVPVLGAAGGAAINALFMSHYQGVAWGHFTVRRLERRYGAAAVEAAFRGLA